MKLEEQVCEFIKQPFPLWEPTLTGQLIADKWQQLKEQGLASVNDYNTSGAWIGNFQIEQSDKEPVIEQDSATAYLEAPSSLLQSFYDEHGLEVLSKRELVAENALSKLQNAFAILKQVPQAFEGVVSLVRMLQVLKGDNPEVDLSYSHPCIPFSIFVSICENDSPVSNLRIAESILHEAMHLKLTLIENVIPLVTSRNIVFYSPWKNEDRPVQGVLHGLFVFKAILSFYFTIGSLFKDNDVERYLSARKREIQEEILLLGDFHFSGALTEEGANLAKNLLPLNYTPHQVG